MQNHLKSYLTLNSHWSAERSQNKLMCRNCPYPRKEKIKESTFRSRAKIAFERWWSAKLIRYKSSVFCSSIHLCYTVTLLYFTHQLQLPCYNVPIAVLFSVSWLSVVVSMAEAIAIKLTKDFPASTKPSFLLLLLHPDRLNYTSPSSN